MPEQTHGFTIDQGKCDGHLACMRVCPTHAIRVKEGKARLLPELCIDCGSCLRVCPSGAIQATTVSVADLDNYDYRVAVPSPVLFGQFPQGITPAHIVAALLGLGFDAVWDFTVELALTNRALVEYVERWEGPYPLISVSCPVVVRLVQVMYPGMIDQLVQIQPPRELAGRELKRKYSEMLGIDRDRIAAVYITPCQAKTISILKPAEGGESHLDGALGIRDVYNDILAITRSLDHVRADDPAKTFVRSNEMLRWATSQGQGHVLGRHRYMSVTGLANIVQVFDDIEKGKLRNIEYLECDACWVGCVGGNLTVDNIYVTLTKINRLLVDLPESDPTLEAEVARRYPNEDFSLKGRVKPRAVERNLGNLKGRVRRIKAEEAVGRMLPGLNCGLCGAPTCKMFARDVATGNAKRSECILLSDRQIRQLREVYLHSRKPPVDAGP